MSSMKTSGIIFDVDGTILDSMPYWINLGINYLHTLGIYVTDEINDIISDMTMEESSEYFKQRFHISKDAPVIKKEMLDTIETAYRKYIPAKQEVQEQVLQFYRQEKRMCILTTSDYSLTVLALKRLGLLECFEHIYTGDMLHMNKRTPDIFLEVCRQMNFLPERTIVYEDAFYAAKAAKAAGCQVIRVYDAASQDDWPACHT